jgi:hypothetical protein
MKRYAIDATKIARLIKKTKCSKRSECIDKITDTFNRQNKLKMSSAWMRSRMSEEGLLTNIPCAKRGTKKIPFIKSEFIKKLNLSKSLPTQQKALKFISDEYGKFIDKKISSMWALSKIKSMGLLSELPIKKRGRAKKEYSVVESKLILKESDIYNVELKNIIKDKCEYDNLYDGYVIFNFNNGNNKKIGDIKENDVSCEAWRKLMSLTISNPKAITIYN